MNLRLGAQSLYARSFSVQARLVCLWLSSEPQDLVCRVRPTAQQALAAASREPSRTFRAPPSPTWDPSISRSIISHGPRLADPRNMHVDACRLSERSRFTFRADRALHKYTCPRSRSAQQPLPPSRTPLPIAPRPYALRCLDLDLSFIPWPASPIHRAPQAIITRQRTA